MIDGNTSIDPFYRQMLQQVIIFFFWSGFPGPQEWLGSQHPGISPRPRARGTMVPSWMTRSSASCSARLAGESFPKRLIVIPFKFKEFKQKTLIFFGGRNTKSLFFEKNMSRNKSELVFAEICIFLKNDFYVDENILRNKFNDWWKHRHGFVYWEMHQPIIKCFLIRTPWNTRMTWIPASWHQPKTAGARGTMVPSWMTRSSARSSASCSARLAGESFPKRLILIPFKSEEFKKNTWKIFVGEIQCICVHLLSNFASHRTHCETWDLEQQNKISPIFGVNRERTPSSNVFSRSNPTNRTFFFDDP